MRKNVMKIMGVVLGLSMVLALAMPTLAEAPQVRWVGEKVVLEKYLGIEWADTPVRFYFDQDTGSGEIEGLTQIPPFPGGALDNSFNMVWSVVGADGYARCKFFSENYGESHVSLTLYNRDEWSAGNQVTENVYDLIVIYLKLEEIKLSSVAGNSSGGNTSQWLPENPWDTTTDLMSETRELSQESLLRVRVKGWFTNSTPSPRQESTLDIDQDGIPDLTMPAGRWILPDDWPSLASLNPDWDIMDQPDDAIMTAGTAQLPPQNDAAFYDNNGTGALVAAPPVIGPFLPGHDAPTPAGYSPGIGPYPAGQQAQKSVVPNGQINWYDAPMPPSLIAFQIKDGVGYLKDASKDTIYYFTDSNNFYHLTNPFYLAMIPAYSDIPAVGPQGGYLWDSWDSAQGPYPFWNIVQTQEGLTPSNETHPTDVKVYSDNHGEAMVYFSRNWNLDLSAAAKIQAAVDYPYYRFHPSLMSNTVTENLLNTEPGDEVSEVTVPLPKGATIVFTDVVSPGTTSLSTSSSGPPLPSGFRLGEGDSALYYDIATTSGYTGMLTISIPYNEAQFPGLVNERDLKVFHWENGEFVDRTVEVDTVNNIIYAKVSSLSDFVMAMPIRIQGVGGEIVPPDHTPILVGSIVLLAFLNLCGLVIIFRWRKAMKFNN